MGRFLQGSGPNSLSVDSPRQSGIGNSLTQSLQMFLLLWLAFAAYDLLSLWIGYG